MPHRRIDSWDVRWRDRVRLGPRLIDSPDFENPEEMAKDRERWEDVAVSARGPTRPILSRKKNANIGHVV